MDQADAFWTIFEKNSEIVELSQTIVPLLLESYSKIGPKMALQSEKIG